MKNSTIAIAILLVTIVIGSLLAFFYLRNNNESPNESTSQDNSMLDEAEADRKAQAKEVFISEYMKEIESEIQALEELIVIQGGQLEESVELNKLKEDEKALREESESLFEIMYTASLERLQREGGDSMTPPSMEEQENSLQDKMNELNELNGSVSPIDESDIQQLSQSELDLQIANALTELNRFSFSSESMAESDSGYVILRRKLQQLDTERKRRDEESEIIGPSPMNP
jgi:hypothetical protein|tara:strand:- start:2750 stop:3439 length:690 start_codon:yes stop_codon:yes gene_type:complete